MPQKIAAFSSTQHQNPALKLLLKRLQARINTPVTQLLSNTQQLVVLGNPVRARQ
jgi:hypothetical protein